MTKYATIKAPPPWSYTWKGNFHRFPRPAAEPIAASMNIHLFDHKLLLIVRYLKNKYPYDTVFWDFSRKIKRAIVHNSLRNSES